jgi:hypothetical protein
MSASAGQRAIGEKAQENPLARLAGVGTYYPRGSQLPLPPTLAAGGPGFLVQIAPSA